MNAIPGATMHGNPVEKIDMGETEIPEEVFMEFIDNMRETYTADSYHLLGKVFLILQYVPHHATSVNQKY